MEPGPISRAFGGVLPNRSGLSSAGSMGSGLGGSRHGPGGHMSNSNNSGAGGLGMMATNSLMAAVGGLPNSSSISSNAINRGAGGGVEIYYKRRAGSVQGRRSKGGSSLGRGSNSHNKPPSGSLLSSLADKRYGKAAPLDFSSSNQNSTNSGSGSTYGNSVAAAAVAAAAAVMDVQQRLRQPLEFQYQAQVPSKQQEHMARNENPVQIVAAAPANSLDTARTRAAKKSVRWSETLTSCNPEKRAQEGQPSASILAVGGVSKTNSNLGSNTGVGGLAGGGSGTGAKSPDKAAARASQRPCSSMSPIRVQVASADTTALPTSSASTPALLGNSNNAQNNDPRTGAPARPHSSSSGVGVLSSAQAGAGGSGTPGVKHKPLLEMRRAMKASNSAQRPSLSEQLAAIGANAGALTASIRANAGLGNDSAGDPPVVVLPAKSFTVGTLSCRYPSPARFYRDRLEYIFHHPYEAIEISMTMHYPDLMQVQLNSGKLRFKLPRRLDHFPSDFNPSNPTHAITIELGTLAAQTILKEKVMPLMARGTGVMGQI